MRQFSLSLNYIRMLVPVFEKTFSSFLHISPMRIMPQLGTTLLLTPLQILLLLFLMALVKILEKTEVKTMMF
jgi:hypothetical protein